MKKLIALLLALPILCCAQSNILTGNIASFGMAGRTNLEMQLSIVSPKHRVINNIFISDDSIISSSDTNGNFSFTNIAFGYYILSASDSTGSRWPILVFTDTAGITQLKSLINFNAAMPQNGGSNYYTIAQINSMFAALSESANTNALTQDQSDRLAMALTNAAAFWTNNDVNGKVLLNNLSIYDMQDNIPLYLQSGTNVNTGWSFPLGDHAFYLSGPGGGGFSFSTLGGSNILGGVSAPAYYSGSGSLLTGIPTNSIDSIFYGLLLAGGNGGNAVANSNGFATNAFLLRPTISVPALPGGENSGAATLVVNTNDNTVGWQPIVPAPTLGNAAGASTNTMKVASATNADTATTATTAGTATNATSGGNIITNHQPVVNFPQSITTSNLMVRDMNADISWSIYEEDNDNLYINSAGFGGSIIFDPASPISGNGSGLTGINANYAGMAGMATMPIGSTLFVMTNGNDATGKRGMLNLPFATVHGAATNAIPGDKIHIGVGSFIVGGGTQSPVTLESNIPINVVIEGEGAATSLYGTIRPVNNDTYQNFTGTNFYFGDGTFYCTNLIVRNVYINNVSDIFGAGASLNNGGFFYATIDSCDFSSTDDVMLGFFGCIIKNTRIFASNYAAHGIYGDGCTLMNSSITVSNNIGTGNYATCFYCTTNFGNSITFVGACELDTRGTHATNFLTGGPSPVTITGMYLNNGVPIGNGSGLMGITSASLTNAVTTNYTLTAGPTLYITNGLIIKIQ